jgi:hypothetical protein
MAGLRAETLQHVTVAARKIPHVAGNEIVGFRLALRSNDGCADAALDDEGPFGRRCVPMQFAHRTWLKPHGNSRDAFGNRQLLDGGFFPIAIANHFSFGFLEGKFKCRQVIA